MKFFLKENSPANHYNLLLFALIVLFIASSLIGDGEVGSWILSSSLLLVIVLIVKNLYLSTIAYLSFLLVALAAFGIDLVVRLKVIPPSQDLLAIADNLIYSMFLAMAIYSFTKDLFVNKKVTSDTLRGGICIYLLIGFLWALIYSTIYNLEPQAFSPAVDSEATPDLVYFSFTTLTTLGYGDVVPVSKLVRVLANLEAVAGLMYPAVFIARLVGLYTAQEISERD